MKKELKEESNNGDGSAQNKDRQKIKKLITEIESKTERLDKKQKSVRNQTRK